ncbi:hypothetical protein [Paenibacillus xylanexedens]|uniref:hypothetical protein n=1 Tax=Paenibacillus xylanexedens TaxID=528191 RepID=UPI003B01B0C1
MTLSIMIVDDDVVSRSMLHDIIESCGIGELAGTPEELFQNTRHERTKAFLGKIL